MGNDVTVASHVNSDTVFDQMSRAQIERCRD